MMSLLERDSSIVNRPTSAMFGDAMISDHDDPDYNSWGVSSMRFDTIFFWYGFRTSLPFTWPLIFFGTFLIPYFLFDHSDGYIFVGSILSVLFCALSLLSYWQIRPWRRHPSILIIMICFISTLISAILLYNAAPHGGDREIDKSDVNVIEDSTYSASDRTATCVSMSFFIQLTLLAREGWILTLSLDLLTSITNPFASYKSNLKQYHIYIWSFTILLAVILVSTKSCQGEFLSNGTCWLRISGADSVCFWGFFMSWVITFYINAAAVLAYAFSRVSKGLETTYATRYACVADTFRVVFLYFIYGMIIAILFLVIYYSYQSGVSDEHLYFLEHCFAYLIACRGFIDALIWFFSHGFVSEKGVVTNLSVNINTESRAISTAQQRRRSRKSTPSKSSANRYPFAAQQVDTSIEQSHITTTSGSSSNLNTPRDDKQKEVGNDRGTSAEEDVEDEDEDGAANGNRRGLLTLSDVFMPDRSLRSLFSGMFFGKLDKNDGSGQKEDGEDDEEGSINAVRKASKRKSWTNNSISMYNQSEVTNATLEDALLRGNHIDESANLDRSRSKASRSQRHDLTSAATGGGLGMGPASITSRATQDTNDVDVSPQLNLTLRREVLALVTHGIQESVTRMIDRDRKLRNQLAEIGVTVYDERDYFQEIEGSSSGSSSGSENGDVTSESDSNYNESEEESASDGYESSSSRASDSSSSSIHSLLSSQHSARSTGLMGIPAPVSTLPSSLAGVRRVVPIQRLQKTKTKERKSDNSSNRPSNSSNSKSKHSRPSSDSKEERGRSSKSRGKSRKSRHSKSHKSRGSTELESKENHGDKERVDEDGESEENSDIAMSPFADLTAAHRAGVAPAEATTATSSNPLHSNTNSQQSQSEQVSDKYSSASVNNGFGANASKQSSNLVSQQQPVQPQPHRHHHHHHHHHHSHHHRSHTSSSHHIPSNIYLTNVNHSFHFTPDVFHDPSHSMSFHSHSLTSSPLHPSLKRASPALSPPPTSLLSNTSPSQPHHKSQSKSQSTGSVPNTTSLPPAGTATTTTSTSHSHTHHYENTVIQNLMHIVGGQYYPGEYGVDNIVSAPGPTTAATSASSDKTHSSHPHHHHHKDHREKHASSTNNTSTNANTNATAGLPTMRQSISQSHSHRHSHSTNHQQQQQAMHHSRLSISHLLSASLSFRFAAQQPQPPSQQPLLPPQATSRRSESNKHHAHMDDTDDDIERAQSADSQHSTSSSASTASSETQQSSATLRQKKQAILNEFRPPGIVVFYFDEQRHRFRDFRPATFRQLRSLAGITEENYLKFIQQPTQERLSEGRSGAFFFICGAGELVVKTIAKNEAMTLLKILDEYRAHFVRNPDSLIVRFLGLHSITLYGTEFYFVVMKNIFPPGQRLQERYDLKGSYIARNAKAANRPGSIATCRHCGAMFVVGDPAATGGLNLNHEDATLSGGRRSGGRMSGRTSDRLSSRFSGTYSASYASMAAARRRKQSGVLEAGSLCPEMAGGHEPSVTLKDNDFTNKIRLHPEDALQVIETIFNDSDALASMGLMDYSLLVGVQHVHYDLLQQNPQVPLLASAGDNNQEYRSYPARVVIAPNQYYFGIIDILQTWDYKKQFEHFIKVNVFGHPYDGISAIPPHDFKRRFQRKIASVIDHASLIREVTGSWQGKREVGNVYSLTSLPPNLSVLPSSWPPAAAATNNPNGSSNTNTNTVATPVADNNNTTIAATGAGAADDDDEDGDAVDSSLLRDSFATTTSTSRHSLIISADQGVNSQHSYRDIDIQGINLAGSGAMTAAEDVAGSPSSALRSFFAERNSFRDSFREKK